jgi:hypothetical protein
MNGFLDRSGEGMFHFLVNTSVQKNGASEGIRTLDTHVGNVMLYQAELRSLPRSEKEGKITQANCKPCFSTLLQPGDPSLLPSPINLSLLETHQPKPTAQSPSSRHSIAESLFFVALGPDCS